MYTDKPGQYSIEHIKTKAVSKRIDTLFILLLCQILLLLVSCNDKPEQDNLYELMDGIFADNAPGIYGKAVEVTLHYHSGQLYWKLYENGSYTEYKAPIVLDLYAGQKEDYPCTISVDAVLDGIYTAKDQRYINNIQSTGDYYLKEKMPVLYLRHIDDNGNIEEQSFTYIIAEDADFTIPVISINIPFEDIFGVNGFYNKVMSDQKQFCSLEFFDPVYGNYFKAESSIKIGGNSTRGFPQKTLNMNFNRDLNGVKNRVYFTDIFGELTADNGDPLDKITRFRLHTEPDVFDTTLGFNDEFLQRLFEGTNAGTLSTRPAIAYINGEYWGLYYITEKWSDTYIKDNYGVAKDNCVIYFYDDHYPELYFFDDGNEEKGNELIHDFVNYYTTHNFSNDQYYIEFSEKYLDIDNFIDYVVSRSFSGDTDSLISSSNNKLWRAIQTDSKNPYSDGRWRFGIHDADYAFSEKYMNLLDKDSLGSFCNHELFDNLLKNRSFRTKFYQRAKVLMEQNCHTQ